MPQRYVRDVAILLQFNLDEANLIPTTQCW
jgi:hypothetical protein